jgi:hypothetical protein
MAVAVAVAVVGFVARLFFEKNFKKKLITHPSKNRPFFIHFSSIFGHFPSIFHHFSSIFRPFFNELHLKTHKKISDSSSGSRHSDYFVGDPDHGAVCGF